MNDTMERRRALRELETAGRRDDEPYSGGRAVAKRHRANAAIYALVYIGDQLGRIANELGRGPGHWKD